MVKLSELHLIFVRAELRVCWAVFGSWWAGDFKKHSAIHRIVGKYVNYQHRKYVDLSMKVGKLIVAM